MLACVIQLFISFYSRKMFAVLKSLLEADEAPFGYIAARTTGITGSRA